jgi:transketolase
LEILKTLREEEVEQLENIAYQIRKTALEIIVRAGWGHIGGSFSIAEMLACLYFRFLNVDPNNPHKPDRDYLILSKAHGSPALYAALALRGFFPKELLYTYCTARGLDGHTKRGNPPGVEFSGGSLGLGLSYAVGLAMGIKMQEQFKQRVYCIMGDGEINEGQVWEAAMSASHYRLDNLIAIVDYNKVGAKGFVHELMSVEPLVSKWNSFGWETREVDGHDVKEICSALYWARYIGVRGKPICIISHTVKGKGIEECEFNYKWHTHAPSLDKAQSFCEELARNFGREDEPFEISAQRLESETLEEIIGGNSI